MISEAMQVVLDKIQEERVGLIAWQRTAKSYREQESNAKTEAENSEKVALEHELRIERLSLELRKVLNGLPSDIPVEAPRTGETEQVGREG